MSELVRAEGLHHAFERRAGWRTRASVPALDGVNLSIGRGEVVGLVGESGSGKSTLGRALLRLIVPDQGRVFFDGTDLATLSAPALRALRPRMQIIFQDAFGSLNPHASVEEILREAALFHGLVSSAEVGGHVAKLLDQVGLPRTCTSKFPREFSGGQRQRIGIARALAVRPEFVVADEPVSALDVSIQAQILNLLRSLREELELTVLLISHDLSVVEHLADRVAVMSSGKIVEELAADRLAAAKHPHTRALLAAASRRQ